jgi:hypothetical protein
MLSTQLSGLVLDYIDVRPGMSVHFSDAYIDAFKEAAAARGIVDVTIDDADFDWHVSDSIEVFTARSKGGRQAVLILGGMNIFRYLYLRVMHKFTHIVCIFPEQEDRGIYMSSLSYMPTFRKAYREAHFGVLGKFLVALKIATTPACFYPILMLVR